MKLRIRGNSVRLRLTKAEVRDLALVGHVEERVQIGIGPDAYLRYRIEAGPISAITSRLEVHTVIISVPVETARHWEANDLVGLYTETAWGLRIAVEKDFRCLDPSRTEDESDAFDNPSAACSNICDGEGVSPGATTTLP
ncbi:MAG TPA: hypothetical protein VMF06_22055 [Candidatus Limnocylindria bacterium]|jgi:hypothetical protein|nr:hypothetical protein [Candidatus Limnocylindria bacterium]